MKKIILLFILQLSMLMAAGITITADKALNRGTVQADEPDRAESTPFGIIPNSINEIWNDMTLLNDFPPAGMPQGQPQYRGSLFRSEAEIKDSKYANIWVEFEAPGKPGVTCSNSINRPFYPINTRIEVGKIYMYIKRNNIWTLITSRSQAATHQGGFMMPGVNPYARPCPQEDPHKSKAPILATASGTETAKPINETRYHAWTISPNIQPASGIQAMYGFVYLRKIVENSNLPDDRDNVHFIAHMSTDRRDTIPGTPVAAGGISRYKEIQKDWTPFNYMTKMTKAELEANPPPLSLAP